MADKGFNIKVIIPTDDGITISDRKIEESNYFLFYNVSNRSYQLAGNVNVKEVVEGIDDFKQIMNELLLKERIDKIVCKNNYSNCNYSYIRTCESEIEIFLNELIDKIEKNELD